ncbi:hypothetical protein ACIF9R_12355 [Streptomyces sp. NPDC086080]|uniref:hypothetical protein n=1 Tax=Streptomyces sp. NPDC086080 TaxID=3365748 RepID=UPI0037D2B453
MQTVQSYPPGTRWFFKGRAGHSQTEELVLYPEPANSAMSDDYLPEEISAAELWRLWAKDCNSYHKRWPERFRPGEIPIVWTVTTPALSGIWELAPHTRDPRDLPGALPFAGGEREDFLTWYTRPIHSDTMEPLNWLRLPVVDKAWNGTGSRKGGFVQEATGWKPSALQPTMNVVEIAQAAGLWAPDLKVGWT